MKETSILPVLFNLAQFAAGIYLMSDAFGWRAAIGVAMVVLSAIRESRYE